MQHHHTSVPGSDDLHDVTVMGIWAHPDDECYLAAGFMMAAAAAGARVVEVTATLGEQGTDDPATWPPERLAPLRYHELLGAMGTLGVHEVEVLGVPDGACAALDERSGVARIERVIDRHRPDVVVTFGPDGVSGHEDHQVVGRWVTEAVTRRAHEDQPGLLHSAAAQVWPADLLEVLVEMGGFYPGYPIVTDPVPHRTMRITGDALDRKVDALRCHRSQTAGMIEGLGLATYRRMASYEGFRPANAAALPWLDRVVPGTVSTSAVATRPPLESVA